MIDQLVTGVGTAAIVTTIVEPSTFVPFSDGARMQVQPISGAVVVAGKLTNGPVQRVERIAPLPIPDPPALVFEPGHKYLILLTVDKSRGNGTYQPDFGRHGTFEITDSKVVEQCTQPADSGVLDVVGGSADLDTLIKMIRTSMNC